MKKILLIATVLFVCFKPELNAQVRVGFLGGGVFSSFEQDGNIEFNTENLSSYGIGAVIEFNISQNASLYLEPMYIERGTKFKFSQFDLPSLKWKLQYIEIPVMLKYSVGEKIKPYMFGGASLGINLNSDLEAGVGGFNFQTDLRDQTKDFSFNLNIGAGISYQNEFISLFVEVRYSFGLNNIVDSFFTNDVFREVPDIIRNSMDLDIKSRGIEIMAGFALPIKW